MRPRLLDLFSGAGGAAKGYHRAGFDVVGVDIKHQPRYPYPFFRDDAMNVFEPWWEFPGLFGDELRLGDFDAIHASPPCQHYSSAGKAAVVTYGRSYPDLYAAVRDRLEATGLPWVIENVVAAPAGHGVVLCGSMFGLDLERHRNFESSELMLLDRVCDHPAESVITVTGHTPQRWAQGKRQGAPRSLVQAAMGIDWMTTAELVQAIPPAYTEWVGARLLESLEVAA